MNTRIWTHVCSSNFLAQNTACLILSLAVSSHIAEIRKWLLPATGEHHGTLLHPSQYKTNIAGAIERQHWRFLSLKTTPTNYTFFVQNASTSSGMRVQKKKRLIVEIMTPIQCHNRTYSNKGLWLLEGKCQLFWQVQWLYFLSSISYLLLFMFSSILWSQ